MRHILEAFGNQILKFKNPGKEVTHVDLEQFYRDHPEYKQSKINKFDESETVSVEGYPLFTENLFAKVIKVHYREDYALYDVQVNYAGMVEHLTLCLLEENYLKKVHAFGEDEEEDTLDADTHKMVASAILSGDKGAFPAEWDDKEIDDIFASPELYRLKIARKQIDIAIGKMGTKVIN